MGDIIIKSNLANLKNKSHKIDSIRYPFVLSKVEDTQKYLACRVNSCFAYDNNLSKLIESVNKAVK